MLRYLEIPDLENTEFNFALLWLYMAILWAILTRYVANHVDISDLYSCHRKSQIHSIVWFRRDL